MAVQVEELANNKVRLKVDVPREDMQHAVEHATSDLAGSVKIPGFRPGKVPMQVLRARLGEERLLTEAVESHIGGWFWNAAASSRIQPIAQPQYERRSRSCVRASPTSRRSKVVPLRPATWSSSTRSKRGARRSVTSCSSLEPAGCSRTSSAR
ncbi:MAG: hypothetical protein AUG88_00240 [Actinobacteria bacterium 13_1_20CM_4_68_12]|nr:MAG: hypothetical protein AUG88_00240 [Actinobacteria bacterium 13_1_20CM_4_68_12]